MKKKILLRALRQAGRLIFTVLLLAQFVTINCISSRAGNFPTEPITQPKPLPQKLSIDFETTVNADFAADRKIAKAWLDVAEKELADRFTDVLKQSQNFDRIAPGTGKEAYHVKLTKDMITSNGGWAVLTLFVSGLGLVLPRFAGTTESNFTFEVSKKDKIVKTYSYTGAKMHDFGWTLFVFVMPFTSTKKVYNELETFTIRKFLIDAETDQIFSK